MAEDLHVVIVGGGFGGLAAARELGNRPGVRVTLIDRRNHHVFQPLLYQVATAALSPADIAGPIRSILSRYANVRVLLDEVEGVDCHGRQVRLRDAGPLSYDRLIIATGARHSYFGRDEWAEHAPGLKSLEDATAVRRRVLLALERAETEERPSRREALLTFVVVGGGPTGIEMAGAIAELARRSVSRDFRHITPHCSRVLLVEASARLLTAFPRDLSEKARRSLEQLGVEVITGRPVMALDEQGLSIGGDRIEAATIIWAAGVRASPAADWLQADRDRQGRVRVAEDCSVPGCRGVYAIGDTACFIDGIGMPLPGIAPVAKQQGRYVARRIMGRTQSPFRYRHWGNLATIGRSRAVLEIGRLHLSGFLAWLLWGTAHLYFLVGFRNRLSVGLSWAWNYLTFARHARLITGETLPAARPAAAE
ncbi:NAD(P)/FAD-dependent oxidoreductase [Sphingomonas arenae]|uniref:NAD(P)/FAD-dependent oxidoreductase n=1 Tax=Sphingomonas arenae TaxID=2812555 RepID=UPI0019688B1A|nr:NAD(P)/FAD-dependent oxidoreductase [Sphingomonas arenae]